MEKENMYGEKGNKILIVHVLQRIASKRDHRFRCNRSKYKLVALSIIILNYRYYHYYDYYIRFSFVS